MSVIVVFLTRGLWFLYTNVDIRRALLCYKMDEFWKLYHTFLGWGFFPDKVDGYTMSYMYIQLRMNALYYCTVMSACMFCWRPTHQSFIEQEKTKNSQMKLNFLKTQCWRKTIYMSCQWVSSTNKQPEQTKAEDINIICRHSKVEKIERINVK